MDIIELINKKKSRKKLTKKEWEFFVYAVCNGQIKDYQTSSMLMAIFLNGLDFDETYNLTIAMANSGEVLKLDDVGECLDKHSTGGVSDTTTLVVVPVLASLGVKVAKMSGRSLGWTGGTADKIEVFTGYKTEISTVEFKKLITKNNASIISPSQDLAIADKILYKLRSETGTVDNTNLIASSIMSKKIACGSKYLILDVKYGSGAFMKNKKDAKNLARIMIKIGVKSGIRVCAVLSNMNQPLSNYIGNNFEVYSALQVLNGEDNNLSKLSKFLCVQSLMLCGKCKTEVEAHKLVDTAIKNGKLIEIVSAQNGSIEFINNPQKLLKENNKIEILSEKEGFLACYDTSLLGNIAHNLQKVNGQILRQDDVGIILNKNIGDHVDIGEKIMTLYFNQIDDRDEVLEQIKRTYSIGKKSQKIKLVDCVLK